jgi:hypothetical protein
MILIIFETKLIKLRDLKSDDNIIILFNQI